MPYLENGKDLRSAYNSFSYHFKIAGELEMNNTLLLVYFFFITNRQILSYIFLQYFIQ